MKYLSYILLIILSLSLISCREQDDQPKELVVDTFLVIDTLFQVDTVTVTKNVNVGDYRDIYVAAQKIIQNQLSGELKLFGEYNKSTVEKVGPDTYKINVPVLWHNGETQIISDVAMNLKYFGGDMKDSDNFVMTWFGQVPKCFFRAPCGQ